MKKLLIFCLIIGLLFIMTGCGFNGAVKDIINTTTSGNKLQENQPTPTDIDYSLERYNLIRRAYWVNGQREKANTLICEIDKPLGYIVLFTEGGGIVGRFVVDGKVSSLNSFLTPDSKYYGYDNYENIWLPDVDGSYGENDSGIFFFTPDGRYIEWTGIYLYSDIPFEVDAPIITISGGNS